MKHYSQKNLEANKKNHNYSEQHMSNPQSIFINTEVASTHKNYEWHWISYKRRNPSKPETADIASLIQTKNQLVSHTKFFSGEAEEYNNISTKIYRKTKETKNQIFLL